MAGLSSMLEVEVLLHQLLGGFLQVDLPEVDDGVCVEGENDITGDACFLKAEDLEGMRRHGDLRYG